MSGQRDLKGVSALDKLGITGPGRWQPSTGLRTIGAIGTPETSPEEYLDVFLTRSRSGRQAVPAPRGIRRLHGGLPRRPSL